MLTHLMRNTREETAPTAPTDRSSMRMHISFHVSSVSACIECAMEYVRDLTARSLGGRSCRVLSALLRSPTSVGSLPSRSLPDCSPLPSAVIATSIAPMAPIVDAPIVQPLDVEAAHYAAGHTRTHPLACTSSRSLR
jgi:hypothetical protein